MASFTLDGIALDIPDDCRSDSLIHPLRTGTYEGPESRAMKRHLVPTDRMVDLGAGALGFCVRWRRGLSGVRMCWGSRPARSWRLPRANLARNGGGAGRVLHGAVVADDIKGDSVSFLARPYAQGDP